MNPKPRFTPAEVGAAQLAFQKKYRDIAEDPRWLAKADKTTVTLQKQWPNASAVEIVNAAGHKARVAKIDENRSKGIAAIIRDRNKFQKST